MWESSRPVSNYLEAGPVDGPLVLVLVHGCGHFLRRERPAVVNAAILDFLG